MSSSPQKTEIENSLSALTKVFEGFQDYRVVGSILVAALNGKPHRELHDIDLIIDKKIYSRIIRRFNQRGFKQIQKHAPGYHWDEYEKPNHLKFGVLLVGKFEPDAFEYRANGLLKLKINNKYLAPTEYTLYGHSIHGIPLRSVYEGIQAANLNTKREPDREIVAAKLTDPYQGLSLSHAFRVQVAGITVPRLYSFISHIYNLIGGARLKLGKSYDPWS